MVRKRKRRTTKYRKAFLTHIGTIALFLEALKDTKKKNVCQSHQWNKNTIKPERIALN